MKVLAINGSPNKEGTTFTALSIITKALESEGIETEIFHIGNGGIHGCVGCGSCRKNKNNQCVYDGDSVNDCIENVRAANGIIIGAPTYFGGIAGDAKCFYDRLFYTGRHIEGKPCAAVTAARRSGGEGVISQLNNYLILGGGVIAPTNYWNYIHGHNGEQALQDGEGVEILQTVGRSMAWLLKCLEATKNTIPMPSLSKNVITNFIR